MSLQSEIHKREPFDLLEQEVALNLARTASRIEADFVRLFRTHGLSGAGYNVLRILRGAGEHGRACREIGDHMVTPVPDVTRLIDRLVRDGLAERRAVTGDRRRVQVHLTESGRRLLDALDEPVRALHRVQLGHLGPDRLRQLNELLVAARSGDETDQDCA